MSQTQLGPGISTSYDIVATIGPATDCEQGWESLLRAGAGRFRINTSHLDLEAIEDLLERLDAFFRARGGGVPVVLDLQGSKWRLGETARRALSAGEVVELVLGGNNDRDGAAPSAAAAGEMPTIPVPHPDFFEACRASSGTKVLVNDARVELRIEAAHERWVRARVTRGGEVSAGKGVTIPASPLRREALSSKDQSIVRLDSSVPEAGFAVSYLRDAREARAYRRQVGDDAYLIGKLERPTAVSERAAIAETVDELWLCRGDLAAEMGLAGMARAVAAVTAEAMSLPVPLLMAGQVFEHMSGAPEPTRAEVVQLYDVLAAGYAGVVLSDETATGLWPEAAVRTAALFQEHAGG